MSFQLVALDKNFNKVTCPKIIIKDYKCSIVFIFQDFLS